MILSFAGVAHAYPAVLVGPPGVALDHRRTVVIATIGDGYTAWSFTGDVGADVTDVGILLSLPAGAEATIADEDLAEELGPVAWVVTKTCAAVAGAEFSASCERGSGSPTQTYADAAAVDIEPGGTVETVELAPGEIEAWAAERGFILDDAARRYVEASARVLAVQVGRPTGWMPVIRVELEKELTTFPGPTADEDLWIQVERASPTRIANLPEIPFEDGCMLPDERPFAEWYDATVHAGAPPGGGWVHERDSGPVTRMRVVGHEGDLVLAAGDPSAAGRGVFEFLAYDERLESVYAVCGEGFRDDPGECPQTSACATAPGAPYAPWLLAFFGALRRRRSRRFESCGGAWRDRQRGGL